jgi:hypothetical protein
MVTSQSSTREDSTDSDIYLASYQDYTSRPDYSNEVEMSLSICWPHAETLEDLKCRHNNPVCPHTPHRWKVRNLPKGGTRFKPIYFNIELEPYQWFEQEEWLE